MSVGTGGAGESPCVSDSLTAVSTPGMLAGSDLT
jgi:hypothetical protein